MCPAVGSMSAAMRSSRMARIYDFFIPFSGNFENLHVIFLSLSISSVFLTAYVSNCLSILFETNGSFRETLTINLVI